MQPDRQTAHLCKESEIQGDHQQQKPLESTEDQLIRLFTPRVLQILNIQTVAADEKKRIGHHQYWNLDEQGERGANTSRNDIETQVSGKQPGEKNSQGITNQLLSKQGTFWTLHIDMEPSSHMLGDIFNHRSTYDRNEELLFFLFLYVKMVIVAIA